MSERSAVIRPDEDGTPDDIFIKDVTLFRMERMDNGCWWIACYQGDKRLSLFLNSKRKIHCRVSEDDLGCVDDGGSDVTDALRQMAQYARGVK